MRTLVGLIVLALGACSGVKSSLEYAAVTLDEAFGSVPSDAGQSGPRAQIEAEDLYDAARAAEAEGAQERAVELYQKAAEGGHSAAAYHLGVAFTEGRGVERDLERGTIWINRAAELGDPQAEFLVGAAYYGGIGVEQDQALAAEYLSSAAEQGHPRAQYLLGEAFASGSGVPKDSAWAARLYGKAARQGHVEAEFAYGVAWAAGLGLPKSESSGLSWLILAAQAGHEKAEMVRKVLVRRVSKKNLALAQQDARAFAPTTSSEFADRPTVVYVQNQLNRLGYRAGPVDGRFGPQTRTAIEAFQRDLSFASNGAVTSELVEQVIEASRRRS